MDEISFDRLKYALMGKGNKSEIADRCGLKGTYLSGIYNGRIMPLSSTLAKVCSVLEVYPSEICRFTGYEIKGGYFTDDKRQKLPEQSKGEVTYKPLWIFLSEYLENHKDKTANDLFDRIETGRKTSEKYKGLSEEIRTKLRNDRPLNMSVIYEICKFLGCSIDFVMGYK